MTDLRSSAANDATTPGVLWSWGAVCAAITLTWLPVRRPVVASKYWARSSLALANPCPVLSDQYQIESGAMMSEVALAAEYVIRLPWRL